MAEALALLVTFPTAFWSALLGVVGVYWAFVMLGALDIDALGGGADGALDGALEGADLAGAVKGATEGLVGASKGAVEGAAKGAAETLADGASHGDGALTSLVSALKLRAVPVTVAGSLLVVFAWLASALASLALGPSDDSVGAWLVRGAVLLAAPAFALLPTSLLVRPLAPLFRHAPAVANRSLVGRVVRVRTGTVTDRFGEATLEDGGAGLVLRVRIDPSVARPRVDGDATPEPDPALQRGDEVVLVDYDETRQEFVVAKLPDLGRG